jgi:hypothetical protein
MTDYLVTVIYDDESQKVWQAHSMSHLLLVLAAAFSTTSEPDCFMVHTVRD